MYFRRIDLKTYKDLEIYCEDLEIFITNLKKQIKNLGDGWNIYERDIYTYISYDGWEADVCLSPESFNINKKLTIPNIIPHEKEPLHLQKYNHILDEFIDKIIKPLTESTNCSFKSTSGIIELSEYFGKQATQNLVQFLKETKERRLPELSLCFSSDWFAFILDCYFSGRICFNDEELKSLFLDEGFPQKEAEYLASEYEKMINFCSYYEAEYKYKNRG